ncbi:MAG: hypothetical protein AAGA11_03710 [Pseudomonadota bacterium]
MKRSRQPEISARTRHLRATRQRLKQAACTLSLFALTVTSAQALDTDIFFDRTVSELPNVVFYMDTSGSMNGSMNNVPIPYNPAQTYSGAFTTNSVYYAPGGRVPNSPSSVTSGQRMSMHCDQANLGIDARGFFTGRMVGRLPTTIPGNPTAEDKWLPVNKGVWGQFDGHLIDCFEDRGVHGENGVGGGTYVNANTTTAWTANAGEEIDWNGAGYVTAFLGNYINYKLNPPIENQSGTRTNKSEAMKRVMINVSHLFPQINAGVARMNGSSGATIVRPVRDNRLVANRTEFENTVNALPASGVTPLAEGLYEVYRYYRGESRLFGSSTGTHPDAISGSNYISPIDHECQRSHVIMFTDGVPWADNDQEPIETLLGGGSCHSGNNQSTGTSCLDDLALYMAQTDSRPGIPNVFDDDGNGTPDGQTVKVHPVGVQIGFQLLEDTATAADTSYFSAQDAIQLENNLVDVLSNIAGTVTVASRVVTSSDQFSRVAHRSEVYTGVYEPNSSYQWRGNVKKYRIAYDGLRPYLTDSDETNNPEILNTNGGIIPSARSYWSSGADGNNVLDGGARERLAGQNPASRNIYGINVDPSIEGNLTNSMHQLSLAQPTVNAALGAATRPASERQDILDYALGYDTPDTDDDLNTGEHSGQIGGFARNEPLAIQYGGTEANPDVVVFAATSDGMLHGFDGETGDEIFAVSPIESVPHYAPQFDNPATGSTRFWGIDGKLSAYVIDKNLDGIITQSAGDRVYLYMPYGLGGRTLYIFDATRANDRVNPVVVALNKKDPSLGRWREYGHALSQAVPLRARKTTGGKSLMAIAMGYDPNAEFAYTGHVMGRGIGLLELETGSMSWSAVSNASTATSEMQFSDMDYAFVAEPSPVDTNGDGFADRVYAVDLGAQVWRFDLADNFVGNSSSSADGGMIAELGRDVDGERRRVFKPIRTALVRDDGQAWVALAFGTGDRMNPLTSTNDNRLYLIRDTHVSMPSGGFPVIDNGDLYDATANTLGTTTNPTALANEYEQLRTSQGWYVNLPNDRKAISGVSISNGIVNYPVYTIPSSSAPCERDIGSGTLYRMKLYDAQPVFDYSGNTTLGTEDREIPLAAPGIPSDMAGHRDPSGNLSECVNMQCFQSDPNATAGTIPNVQENYWFQQLN